MNCEAQTDLQSLVTNLLEQGAWKCLPDVHLKNRAHTLKGIENTDECFSKCDLKIPFKKRICFLKFIICMKFRNRRRNLIFSMG